MIYATPHIHTCNHTARHRAVMLVLYVALLLGITPATAEIVIRGNVYGGGNVGDLKKSETAEGSTKVVLRGGRIEGSVYGGARMADVEGHTYVNLDGEHQTDMLLVNAVYGGNDIAGTIGTVGTNKLTFTPKAPSLDPSNLNALLHATPNTKFPMVVGSLYGGGNGDYNYLDDEKKVVIDGEEYVVSNRPVLARTYIELGGGIYSHVFGGGNKATVTESTTIYADNQTLLNGTLNCIDEAYAPIVAFDEEHHVHRDEKVYFDYHVGCLFGGNNLVDMAIRPTWYLKKMDINNLYSGGNRGGMTFADGLILPIRSDGLRVNNVYGGCRIADVNPGGTAPEAKTISTYDFDKGVASEYTFEAGYATRVYITAGRVNNVYGGNDIAGTVYHGSNVDIHGGLIGNVYGGGNGSYAYTDNPAWVAAHPEDADLLYSIGDYDSSVEALYHHRPHVESTLLHISGGEEANAAAPVVVFGDVYCGGNSATLAKEGDQAGAKSIFKIGKNVIINGAFLGSNGVNMVTPEIIKKYKATDEAIEGGNKRFSQIDLASDVKDPTTGKTQMERYMDGVAVNIKPQLLWDEGLAQSAYIGSLYFGGNKGSMTYEGMADINVPRDIVIYEKVVGGCNDACVTKLTEGEGDAAVTYNADYQGGVIGERTEIVGTMQNVKVKLHVDAYLKPMKLDLIKDANKLFVEDYEFVWDMTEEVDYETFDNHTERSQTFVDANIYGGCFNSGYIKGDVVINIDKALIHPDVYSHMGGKVLRATGEDVYGSAMAVYGAGYGKSSVVEGSTQINLTDNACVLLVFGGGEMGEVTENTEVNFDLSLEPPTGHDKLNVYKAYAGGYAGYVDGNTTLNLQSGAVMRAFAGACNANIGGYTTAIIGVYDEEHNIYPKYGMPYVQNAVFGGNDFGGHISGHTKRTIDVKQYHPDAPLEVIDTKTVRSQTYVQYNNGNIGKAIYGGSYGSYNYEETDIYKEERGLPLEGGPFFEKDITDADDDETVITANTFVHIASKSLNERDIIGQNTMEDPSVISAVMGGGRGYRNLPGYAKVKSTYVLFDGIESLYREKHMAYRIYGGGNLSLVDNTRVDVYACYVDQIFGGTHGVKTLSKDDNVPYNVENTVINLYGHAGKSNIYGAGANSGTNMATINLLSGVVHNVHGGAFTEGYTLETNINVPANSTAQVNAIFGGGQGEADSWPCDVGVSNITYASLDATVEEGIFGGNNEARVTTESNITINVPVKNQGGQLREIYGAGYGDQTVSGFTTINLLEGAQVANVYGGGKEGKVYNHYSYYGNTDNATWNDAINFYYDSAPHRHGNWFNGKIQPTATKTAPKEIVSKPNTRIIIAEGAVVENNVYGGGQGSMAYVSGETQVDLQGGLVKGDIYGGGDAGAMPRMTADFKGYIDAEKNNQTIETHCHIDGGQVRKVFGGGLNGDIEGDTYVAIGRKQGGATFIEPAILRNVYGGSERAEVTGQATVDMWNGYIGYAYDSEANDYIPVLDLEGTDASVSEFEEEGNIYGAGYGEGAVVINTQVNLYGGRVRNSVYGGGEIAAVGKGVVAADMNSAKVNVPGVAQVFIYGGQVDGDVFGGGRGYSYTYTYTGEDSPYQVSREYTDGYVFGRTNVEIYRGTIGTPESLLKGHGNVFGGGNIGYVYAAGKKYTGEEDDEEEVNVFVDDDEAVDAKESLTNKRRGAVLLNAAGEERILGHYYRADDPTTAEDERLLRSEECRVLISAGCVATAEVTINGKTYAQGQFVPTEELNTLAYGAEQWKRLDMSGVTIRNAVFAGGNVSSGSDVVYANAKTVFGNATASVVDAFNRDLISIGGEHIGGLYGDGNLTFVDGYRELNITNYGTEHEQLSKTPGIVIEADVYNNLIPRQKEYYAPYGGQYKLLDGRMINTLQRADFCGIFGSRVLLHGAQDRVPDKVDYTNYAINRVGEISFNKKTMGDVTPRGNYFGIYNVANFLGALTSDVLFTDIRKADGCDVDGHPTHSEDETTSYMGYKSKKGILNTDDENIASARNVVAQASGVFLELVKELDADGNKVYGPITGVIQLELIDVMKGEGGGYVYAKKEYGKPDPVENTEHHTLATANAGAITQRGFTYGAEHDPFMQTSGNFVNPLEVVVDDPYSETAHYWHIRGEYYVYDMYISAYTGTPQAFSDAIDIPLPKLDEAMEAFFVSVNTTKYAKTKADGTPLAEGESMLVNNKVYYLNDPITYREWSMLSETAQEQFVDVPTDEIRHDKGYVLNYGMTNPTQWGRFEPTFTCNKTGVYGRHRYEVNDVVNESVKDDNVTVDDATDATFDEAYIAMEEVSYRDADGRLRHIFEGSYISKTILDALTQQDNGNKAKFEKAYICNVTYQKNDKEYIFTGELISTTEYQNLDTDAQGHFALAYVCTKAGLYGGKEYTEGAQYTALQRANLTIDDLQYFDYNYDALDLLTFTDDIDTDFDADSLVYEVKNEGNKWISKQDIVASHEDSNVPLPLTATAQLYVPRVADLSNLGDERIFTVEYWVEPTNKEGLTDDMKEKHIVNIHIQFKSGTPEIGNLATPSTVMPGSSVGLVVPTVVPGAYEVIGSGWEIYDNIQDAEAHQNGHPFVNNNTPLYWYQNAHYVAFYTNTYLGRTYSNAVPLTVANYHRMGEVMNADEYMYIDHEDIRDRGLNPAKIYLDAAEYEPTSNAVGKGKNDLDYFYDLFVATTDGTLDETVKNGYYLDFILRSDIAPSNTTWRSIGNAENCFSGRLHGNGYTISGLSNSLFGNLCGEVYNLGVTGSFTGGGVADNGGDPSGGYAENCWVYTTETPATNTAAVIGEGGTVKNSYYRDDNSFIAGQAISKTKAEFDKGEVAYLLNGFFLTKRTDEDAVSYVEDYFDDGDFRFGNGTLPKTRDERYTEKIVDGKKVVTYVPVFPDDYIYFGQTLTFVAGTHEALPTRVDKVTTDGKARIVRSEQGNRVYRAPGYYMSKEMDKVYYNAAAVFVAEYADNAIYRDLTAIDFTGYNDKVGMLDYELLKDISVSGLTPNLLLYANSTDASYGILTNRLYEPNLSFDYSTDGKTYGRVDDASGNVSSMKYHLVQTVNNKDYVANTDHYLVDKANFNAPIAYTFEGRHRMWYQRNPAYYSNGSKEGWEAICLPFDAKMTTTQTKGQITHFYGDKTAGHEYWLRELKAVDEEKSEAEFYRPDAVNGPSLFVNNTFLYDYYYSYNDRNDENGDAYHDDYYSEEREYKDYPYVKAYTPYIVAFPGARYYEFDMSGLFQPEHSGEERRLLPPQIVTFISKDNATIGITDDAVSVEVGNYSYKGSFVNAARTDEYVMNAKGSAFAQEEGSAIVPFRGYMMTSNAEPARPILIGSVSQEEEPTEEIIQRGLKIWGKGEAIYIESTLEYEAVVTIHSLSGQIVNRVTVKPMSKEVVPVSSRGVYIVNNKKVAVL